MSSTITPILRKVFAPNGTLRASINLGIPVLAGTDKDTGRAKGVSVDLATALGLRPGLSIELLPFNTAQRSVEAVTREQADIGFFAIDPVRGAAIHFTPPYLLIEGCYLVRESSHFQSNDEVDAQGHRIAVGKGSAYDLYHSQELKRATIVHAPSSAAVVDIFSEQRLDVAAGVKQQLEADARHVGCVRLLPGRFVVIRQAMGRPKARGRDAAEFLSAFVEDMKAAGFVAEALKRHNIGGASIAPKG